MLAYNTTNYEEIALKRFEENIGVLNFYFDTPIITQIQLELRQVNECAQQAQSAGLGKK